MNPLNLFEFNLALVLGHTLIFEARSDDPEMLFYCQSDPRPASTSESTNEQLQAYIQNMPALTSATSSAMLPLAQAQQAASNATAPQQSALESQLYAQFAPQDAATGNRITAQNAGANADLLNGQGGAAAIAAENLQKQLDPQYYATRDLEASKQQDLLKSIDVNGLSGSERAEVQRSNAQQDASRGIANTPSQTATTNNAMNFGSALEGKRNSLEKALSSATSFLPSSQGPVNGFQVATGAPSNSGTTTPTNFGGGTGSAGASNANSLGTSLLGGINNTATNNANITANRRDLWDRTAQAFSSVNA